MYSKLVFMRDRQDRGLDCRHLISLGNWAKNRKGTKRRLLFLATPTPVPQLGTGFCPDIGGFLLLLLSAGLQMSQAGNVCPVSFGRGAQGRGCHERLVQTDTRGTHTPARRGGMGFGVRSVCPPRTPLRAPPASPWFIPGPSVRPELCPCPLRVAGMFAFCT